MKPPTKRPSKPAKPAKPLVFVVDDEPVLRDLAEFSLKGDGYRIRKFDSAETALKSFQESRTKPAVLVSDYALGKGNGIDLIADCKQACPQLKTVLVSGTVGAEIILNAPVKVDRFVGKPYQPELLAQYVRELLAT